MKEIVSKMYAKCLWAMLQTSTTILKGRFINKIYLQRAKTIVFVKEEVVKQQVMS